MYGLIAEDDSDVEMLKILIRRLAYNSSLPINQKGYDGCGQMLRKGAARLRLLADLGCTRFVVCYDADGPDRAAREKELVEKVIGPSKLARASCLTLVPVQEIEAWIFADVDQAVPHVISSWHPDDVTNPEGIPSPKEELERRSRDSKRRPRYAYTTHNPQVARYLDLDRVSKKCPAFRVLERFVRNQRPIRPPAEGIPAVGGRRIWAYTDPENVSQYAGEICTAQEWAEFIRYVESLEPSHAALTQLCGFGWARGEELVAGLAAALAATRAKASIRRVAASLQAAIEIHQEVRHIGLSDGTGPLCPLCGSHETEDPRRRG